MASLDTPAVAALLREYGQRSALRGGNPYRAKAYSRAADSLGALAEPLDRIIAEDRLNEIPGVGDAIADIITKLQVHGTHPSLEAMRKDLPAGVLEMLSVPGLRPDKVVKLYKELGITSLKELERAARKDRIKGVKGLGAALQTKILRNLEISRSAAGRLHIHRAASLLENAQATLRQTHPELTRITSAGDFRRGCELVGDFAVMAQAPALEEGQTVLRGGGTLTVHLSDAAHYGAALLFATGSQAHLEALQSLAVQTRASMVDIVRGEGKVQFGGLKGHWIGTQAGVLQGLHDRRANLVGLRFGGQEDVLSTLLEFSGLRERPGGFPRPRPLSLRARFSLSSRAIEARGGSRVRDRADSRPRWCEHGFRFGNDKRPKSRGVPSS